MRGKNRAKSLGISINPGSGINSRSPNQRNDLQLHGLSGEFSGTGLSLVRFSDEMQPYMLELAFKCR
jgi:hypothetical protein